MKNIKEITVFSEGDSLDLSCWSNVPYLFTKSLEKRGIKVNRVNIYSNKYIRKTIWRYLCEPVLDYFYKKNEFRLDQTALNRWFVQRRIRQAIRKYKNSDLNLYLSYAYLEDSSIPNILFSDWTTEYVLRERLHRFPYKIEKKYLDIQRWNMEHADCVFGLFPDISRVMEQLYKRKIYYLNQNVINNVYDGDLKEDEILARKKDSQILLFIGGKKYLEGARSLVNVFSSLKKRYPLLELHIIGLSDSDFRKLPSSVVCHGFLNKSIEQERDLYYSLLLQAKLFVNPTPLWAGYSSTIEAMYFYTPVVVSNYPSFVSEFGEDIDFGYYVRNQNPDTLYEGINSILDNQEYNLMVLKAHEVVKSYTWDSYVDHFLQIAQRVIDK